MEIPENKLQAIREAIHAGPEHKIAAIKLVREATGCGLAEAKEFVEKSAAELNAKPPGNFSAPPPRKAGCLGLVLAIAATLGAMMFVLVLIWGR
ncbi:MAG: ribosomal protein L7/L12 [Verrucomicrobia bacterium]|nr:ribosomal protein L7/L12 [Verrucomicrobiota bacterium]